MNAFTRMAVIGVLAFAGSAFAQSSDPSIMARQELMEKGVAASTKVLGDMAGGKAAFDAAAAEAARTALVGHAAQIPARFETNVIDAESEAKPEIWAGWDDFLSKAKALETAAAAMDTSSLETLQAGMGAVGGACKDCHTTYRAMK
jgi:cytochrome c556